jgi:Leucine-rich repeat (LRR) protein
MLSGDIPPQLGQLKSLKVLSLRDSKLTGSIPVELGQLDKLEVLKLSNNKLTGNIPVEVGNLVNLKDLWLQRNEGLIRIKPTVSVTNTDLQNNRCKYSVDVLEQNIEENHLDENILVCTQTLTPEFCVKYILNLVVESGGEESYTLDVDYILRHQKHITEKELSALITALKNS